MYKAVLFDLDGTLLDTADDLGAALNHVLNKHGLPATTKEQYTPVASDGAKGLLELGFGDKLSTFDFAKLRQELLDYYQANIAEYTQLYSGMLTLLQTLNEQQIPWGIITNKPIGLTELLLPNYKIFQFSKVTLGGDSLAKRKPHPAPLLFAAEQIKIAPQHCIYVGDAPRDIEAANRAHMLSAIASWGYIPDLNECSSWQANTMLTEPSDILSLLS